MGDACSPRLVRVIAYYYPKPRKASIPASFVASRDKRIASLGAVWLSVSKKAQMVAVCGKLRQEAINSPTHPHLIS